MAYLAGCTGWHEVAAGAPPPISDRPQLLRLDLRDGRQLELKEARIVGDSVIGGSPRSATAVRDITRISDRRSNGGKTLIAVVGTLGAKYILQEQISPSRWAGVLLVCAGVALVAAG
jgi:hypothetical protein